MKGLEKRGNVWRVRIAVPHDLRAQWGKREEIVSLNTADQNEAIRLGGPIIADIKDRIAALRQPGPAMAKVAAPIRHAVLDPRLVFDAIDQWRFDEIEGDYVAFSNGVGVAVPEEEPLLRLHLQHYDTIQNIVCFEDRLASLLGVSVDHSILKAPRIREHFRKAWNDVEFYNQRFSLGLFDGWDEESPTPHPSSVAPATPPTTITPVALAGMTISELRDAWDVVKPLEPKQKGYIRRLIEYLCDVDIAAVTPIQMDRFLVELKRFPLSRRPSDDKLTFTDLIAKYDGTDQNRLSERTLYVWTTVYKAMFEYAVSRRLLTHNPAHKMMTKPTQDEPTRTEYTEAHLDFLFTRPMFKGFDGPADSGYRDKPGSKVVKDGKYWLPIVALHTGMRLDEMATLNKSELIERDGILAFDLTGRPLTGRARVKNATSRRLVPLHRRLIDLGFVEWAKASLDPHGFIFADLKFDARDKRGSQYSKWWGLWCGANAEGEGAGIADPRLTFHSFRHTFKRAARETVDRDIHDILTGHTDGSVSAGYGRGVSLPVLKMKMDEIKIRWP